MYQRLGTPVTLGCPNHELSGEFFNWLYSHKLFHGGRPAWFFKAPFLENYKSPVGDWLEHRQDLANLARPNLKHVQERELTRRNRTIRPAPFKVGGPCAGTPLAIAHMAPPLSAGPLLWALPLY